MAPAILLTASGRAFSAGGDFAWFPSLDSLDRLERLRRDAKQMIWDLLDVPLPLVAAVNGPAVGLGASIALLCDVIFMAESAHVADPHVLVGIVAGDRALPSGRARGQAGPRQAVSDDRRSRARAEASGSARQPRRSRRSARGEALAFAGRLARGARSPCSTRSRPSTSSSRTR
ncbi:MAG: enoyl-CoA hydratase/isomerase family protein [Myxococcota bacterium]